VLLGRADGAGDLAATHHCRQFIPFGHVVRRPHEPTVGSPGEAPPPGHGRGGVEGADAALHPIEQDAGRSNVPTGLGADPSGGPFHATLFGRDGLARRRRNPLGLASLLYAHEGPSSGLYPVLIPGSRVGPGFPQ